MADPASAIGSALMSSMTGNGALSAGAKILDTLLGGTFSQSSGRGGSSNFGTSRSTSEAYSTWDTAALYNAAMMDVANKFNSAEAAKNRDWQEKLSNTAYQRRIRDMKAAGLNPVLRAQLGGRSTPSGATATSATANIGAESRSNSQSSSYSRGSSYEMNQATSIPAVAQYLMSGYNLVTGSNISYKASAPNDTKKAVKAVEDSMATVMRAQANLMSRR